MQAIIEIGLAFLDLVKAELEQAKTGAFGLCIAVGFGFAGTALAVCGIGLILYSIYLALLSPLGAAGAVFLTALAALGFAVVLLWVAIYKVKH